MKSVEGPSRLPCLFQRYHTLFIHRITARYGCGLYCVPQVDSYSHPLNIDIQFICRSHSISILNFVASVRGATVSTSTRIGSPIRRLDAEVVWHYSSVQVVYEYGRVFRCCVIRLCCVSRVIKVSMECTCGWRWLCCLRFDVGWAVHGVVPLMKCKTEHDNKGCGMRLVWIFYSPGSFYEHNTSFFLKLLSP